MANDASFREADVLSQELICQESDSPWSQVTAATKSEPCPTPQDEAVPMSESGGIPEVPGSHKTTTCKDVGFFAAASATYEAILASRSESHLSDASGSTEGDYAESGTQGESFSNFLLPLKNAARVPDLFRTGTEGDSGKGQISTVEGKESGISLNESLLLSVDLTSADLGTICDVNDQNYYRQMVLRSLLNADDTEPSESERRVVPEDEAALNEDKEVGQEMHDTAGENVASSLVEAGASREPGRVCVKSDERLFKFRVVQLYNSSQDVLKDAAGSNAKNSGASLPAANTKTSMEETVANVMLDTDLYGIGDADSEERDDKSFSDMLPLTDTKNICDSVSEIDMDLQRYSSGDRVSIPSVDEIETDALQTGELVAMETHGLSHRSRSDTAVRRLEKNARRLKNKSILLLEALFRAGTDNSLTASVRAGLCVAAVFIVLYAPSTLVNILTLYLQLLVCAIFVDIFLN